MPFEHTHLPPSPSYPTSPTDMAMENTQHPNSMDTDFPSPSTAYSPAESQFSTSSLPSSISSFDLDMDSEAMPTSPVMASNAIPLSPAFLAAPINHSTGIHACQDAAAGIGIGVGIATVSPSGPPPTLTSRRAAENTAFREKVRQMALPLAPLVQLTTGDVHPRFPATLLNFWLLTDHELESLASFYHQRTPCVWTRHYPCPVAWSPSMPLEEKRRKIGKFIGLRGCETPVSSKSEEQLMEEARQARWRDEDEMWRRKTPW
ncbi:hypothetical protein PG993_001477 [Apiospora rasikravindrae]|uniref:Uncharacterized protein n=1 Tax=Apiospora rasikravindrae TaxID=990691 RepID=A0ABR1UBI1_9PEZI